MNWRTFKQSAADIAAVGEALLDNPDQGEVAILSTLGP
jgi:hypothetical protein